MQLVVKRGSMEVWAEKSRKDDVYELFADKDGIDFIGTASSINEAKRIARRWIDEYQ